MRAKPIEQMLRVPTPESAVSPRSAEAPANSRLSEELVVSMLQAMPSSVATARRLCQLLSQDDTPLHKIEAVLLVDPMMAASLIRYANSASQGAREAVGTVNDALNVLGFGRASRYVSSRAFDELLPERFELYSITSDEFRYRSTACALAMDCLSSKGTGVGGTKYTIGLLHAFGEIIIDRFVRENVLLVDPVLFQESNEKRLLARERHYFGLDRAKTAAIALRKWGFPSEVIRPIEFQYQPTGAGEYYEDAFNLSIARYISELIIEDARGESSARNAKMNLSVGRWSLEKLFDQVGRELQELGAAV